MLLLYVCVGVCVTLDESVPTWCYVESVVCPLQVQTVLMYLNFWCTFSITLSLILFHYHLLMNTTNCLVDVSILMVISDGQKLLVLFWSIYGIIQDYFCSSFDWQPLYHSPVFIDIIWYNVMNTLVLFLLSLSPALSAGEFDLTVLYSASLLVLYISACTLHLCSLYMTVSLLLLYTLYSASRLLLGLSLAS